MTPQQSIKLVTVDMDGTLLNAQGVITRRTVAAIKAIQAAGVVFSICTGRFYENASILIKDYGIDCPMITVNGGRVCLGPFGACLLAHKMPSEHALPVLRALEEMDARYYVFGDGFVAIRHDDDRHHSQIEFGKRMETEAGTSYYYGKEACELAIAQGVYKFYIHSGRDAGKLRRIRQRLQDLQGISLTQSSDYNIEVMPKGIDKAHGVRELAAYLQIPISQVMAIGDRENDLPMLTAAGFGVAMGNAREDIKQAADAVTASNEQDGVAQALERYVLGMSVGQP